MWIGILFICQTLCQILLSWLILPPDPSVPSSPLTAAAVNSAMALAQLSSCCLLAPCLIYLISKATLLQSLIGHHLCLPIILRWWMIQLSKTRSMSIMVTHMWSLPAVVTQWNKVAWWQIWTKHSSWLSIMQGVVMVYLEALLSQFLVGLVWEKISLWLLLLWLFHWLSGLLFFSTCFTHLFIILLLFHTYCFTLTDAVPWWLCLSTCSTIFINYTQLAGSMMPSLQPRSV